MSTVAEMIKALEQMPPDAELRQEDEEGYDTSWGLCAEVTLVDAQRLSYEQSLRWKAPYEWAACSITCLSSNELQWRLNKLEETRRVGGVRNISVTPVAVALVRCK
jgi:hypothetical protein